MTFYLPGAADEVVVTVQPLGQLDRGAGPRRATATSSRHRHGGRSESTRRRRPDRSRDRAASSSYGGAFEVGVAADLLGCRRWPSRAMPRTPTSATCPWSWAPTSAAASRSGPRRSSRRSATGAGIVRARPLRHRPDAATVVGDADPRVGRHRASRTPAGSASCGSAGSARSAARRRHRERRLRRVPARGSSTTRAAATSPPARTCSRRTAATRSTSPGSGRAGSRPTAQPLPPATPPVDRLAGRTVAVVPVPDRRRGQPPAGMPPAELTDERDFDPRSLLRYLIAFEPDTGVGAPSARRHAARPPRRRSRRPARRAVRPARLSCACAGPTRHRAASRPSRTRTTRPISVGVGQAPRRYRPRGPEAIPRRDPRRAVPGGAEPRRHDRRGHGRPRAGRVVRPDADGDAHRQPERRGRRRLPGPLPGLPLPQRDRAPRARSASAFRDPEAFIAPDAIVTAAVPGGTAGRR